MGKPWVELSPRSHRSLQHDIDDVFEAYRVASAVMSNPQLQLLLAHPGLCPDPAPFRR